MSRPPLPDMTPSSPSPVRSVAVIHTDGASSGNPGDAGIGAVIEFEGLTHEIAEYIGETTNNVSEYTALIRALQRARQLGISEVDIYMDSELIVRQVSGRYKVKHPGLKPLFDQVSSLLSGFARYRVSHVRREQNTHADRLSKKGIEMKNRPAPPQPKSPVAPVASVTAPVKTPAAAKTPVKGKTKKTDSNRPAGADNATQDSLF